MASDENSDDVVIVLSGASDVRNEEFFCGTRGRGRQTTDGLKYFQSICSDEQTTLGKQPSAATNCGICLRSFDGTPSPVALANIATLNAEATTPICHRAASFLTSSKRQRGSTNTGRASVNTYICVRVPIRSRAFPPTRLSQTCARARTQTHTNTHTREIISSQISSTSRACLSLGLVSWAMNYLPLSYNPW